MQGEFPLLTGIENEIPDLPLHRCWGVFDPIQKSQMFAIIEEKLISNYDMVFRHKSDQLC